MAIELIFSLGLLIVSITAWLITQARNQAQLMAVKNEAEVAKTQLQERLEAASQDIQRLRLDLSKMVELERTLASLHHHIGVAEAQNKALTEQMSALRTEYAELANQRERLSQQRQDLSIELAETKATLKLEIAKTVEKLELLKTAKIELSNQFNSLANSILYEKAKKFTEQNQYNLNTLLSPLKTQLSDFKAKVEQVYIDESKDRSALAKQVESLLALNNQLSTDAHNLTTALKGQTKTQGNWGELILEKVLEASG
ncbi:MAG: DNA recombination protein RmuC, partial [Methylophilaceae bacterium]|nr:DNA recombination protein RmuC [Methylophilaceae bacterium]